MRLQPLGRLLPNVTLPASPHAKAVFGAPGSRRAFFAAYLGLSPSHPRDRRKPPHLTSEGRGFNRAVSVALQNGFSR